jgi:hypothetical protein
LETIAFDTDVSEELFNIVPEPGTYVLDDIRKIEYTITDPNFDPFAGPIDQEITANRYVMFRAILIIIGSILILVAMWLWLKFRNK